MNKDRIQALITALEGGKDEDFYMGRFMNSCGTPACVLGHYAARPDLQDVFKIAGRDWDDGPSVFALGDEVYLDDLVLQEHFDLTQSQVLELFDVYGCGGARTREEAISYLREFIKNA